MQLKELTLENQPATSRGESGLQGYGTVTGGGTWLSSISIHSKEKQF